MHRASRVRLPGMQRLIFGVNACCQAGDATGLRSFDPVSFEETIYFGGRLLADYLIADLGQERKPGHLGPVVDLPVLEFLDKLERCFSQMSLPAAKMGIFNNPGQTAFYINHRVSEADPPLNHVRYGIAPFY